MAVDPEALARASAVIAGYGPALALVRGHLAEVTAGLGAWAVDGSLPGAAPRTLATIRWQADRVTGELVALAERLARAGTDYALTEREARKGLERDSPATP
jgi:hypothetical protein